MRSLGRLACPDTLVGPRRKEYDPGARKGGDSKYKYGDGSNEDGDNITFATVLLDRCTLFVPIVLLRRPLLLSFLFVPFYSSGELHTHCFMSCCIPFVLAVIFSHSSELGTYGPSAHIQS